MSLWVRNTVTVRATWVKAKFANIKIGDVVVLVNDTHSTLHIVTLLTSHGLCTCPYPLFVELFDKAT